MNDVVVNAGASTPATDRHDRGPVVLAALAVTWLAATLWSAHATISDFTDGDVYSLTRAALVLPVVVTGSLVAGVALGLAVVPRLRLPALAVGAGVGLVVGAAVAALMLIGYGTGSALVTFALSVAAASTLGGLVSGLRWPAVVGAALAGTFTWLLIGLLQGILNDQLLNLFGAGETPASRVSATSRLLLTVALVGATLAGILAYRYLRARDTGLGWPAYLAAGAGPGLLLLLANLVALGGGARLRALAAMVSDTGGTSMSWTGMAGVNTALVVLFVGAIAAMIAFGRTLKRPDADLAADRAPATAPEPRTAADPHATATRPTGARPAAADPAGPAEEPAQTS